MRQLVFLMVVLAACTADTFTGPDAGDAGGAESGPDGAACTPTPMACVPNGRCATFDDGTLGPFAPLTTAEGSVAPGPDEFVTCPNSLVATLGVVSSSGGAARAAADTTVQLTNNPSVVHVTLEADVWLPDSPAGPAVFLSVGAAGSAQSTVFVQYAGSPGQWTLGVQASGQSESISPRTGTWNHMTLDVIFSNDTGIGQASLSYVSKGGDALTTPAIQDRTVDSGGAIPTVGADLGIVTFSATTASMTAYYDDVVFSWQ
jgi:hypothetical protein